MKAKVQYNDFCGTTAADRSDYLVTYCEDETSHIAKNFSLPIEADNYRFVGLSVYGTLVDDMYVSFIFKEKTTNKYVKCCKDSVKMESILSLFKRFNFQVGSHLENIREEDLILIED